MQGDGAYGQAQSGGEREFVAPRSGGEYDVLGCDVALRGAYSCDAAGVSEERERGGVGEVGCAETLGGLREGACGVRRAGLTIGGAVAAGDDLRIEAGYELMDLGAVQESHAGETHVLLLLYECGNLGGFAVAFGEQELTALAIAQVGCEFFGERGPALDGFACKLRLGGVASLASHAARAGPGCCRFAGDICALDDEDALALTGEVIGDGVADDAAADDGDVGLG